MTSQSRKRELDRVRSQKRNRCDAPRPKTLSAKMTVRQLVKLRLANDAEEAKNPPPTRPRTRGDCVNGLRPCPWACRYSLMYEVTDAGGVKVLHPGPDGFTDQDYTGPSCALDVADDGEHVLEDIAPPLNITRERVRQLEERALRKLANGAAKRMREDAKEDATRREDGWPW